MSFPPSFDINPSSISLKVNLIENNLANQTYNLPKVSDDTVFIDLNFGAQTEIDFTNIKIHPFYLKM